MVHVHVAHGISCVSIHRVYASLTYTSSLIFSSFPFYSFPKVTTDMGMPNWASDLGNPGVNSRETHDARRRSPQNKNYLIVRHM
jgi:hypothetical protein